MNSFEKAEENFQFDSGLSGASVSSLRTDSCFRSNAEYQSGVGIDQGEGINDNLLSDNFLNSGPNVPDILISGNTDENAYKSDDSKKPSTR